MGEIDKVQAEMAAQEERAWQAYMESLGQSGGAGPPTPHQRRLRREWHALNNACIARLCKEVDLDVS